ncbi:MAG: DNA-binding transcriptional MerR regulator [Planctomycetota bacterium]|jgi:DNA-binding transcriptional MerR regulator
MIEKSTNYPAPDLEDSDDVNQEKTYSISELAKEFDLTTRAIRFYEDEALISPVRIGRQRIYGLRDHTRLKLILRGKRLGFSLTEIREMFELYDSAPGEAAQLRLILKKVTERKTLLEQQLEDIRITMYEITGFENQCKRRLTQMES